MKNAKGRNEETERMVERVMQVSNRRPVKAEEKARPKSPGGRTPACLQKGRESGWPEQVRTWATGDHE